MIDDRYRILAKIATGGMGSVYEGEHLGLRRRVAIKVIRKEHAGDGEITARFEREALAVARIDHPHVAGALDFGELEDGEAYLVMPLVRGPSLQEELETNGPLDWRRATALGAQVADALSAAHSVGIIHRDLKPDNIMLDQREDGTEVARVLDFGIAAVVKGSIGVEENDSGRPLTRRGTVVGTPGYMAPEQAMGEEVDATADLYSLGVVLWECLTGKSLFKGRDLTSIVAKQLTERMPTVTNETGNPEIPAELNELVAELLAGERGDRSRSALEVRDRLRALSYQSGTGERALVAPQPAESRTDSDRDAVDPTPRRSKKLWIAAGVTIGLVALTLLVWPAGEAKTPGKQAEISSNDDASESSPEVAEHIEGLLNDRLRAERRRHGEWLLDQPSNEVPRFALAAAQLELARSCTDRRDALESIRKIGDVKALPTVERYHTRPQDGCGPGGRTDCYACIRDDLQHTMTALGQ